MMREKLLKGQANNEPECQHEKLLETRFLENEIIQMVRINNNSKQRRGLILISS